MASGHARLAAPLAVAAGVLLAAPAALAQSPTGVPSAGPPPGFGGTLVADPAFNRPPDPKPPQPPPPPPPQPQAKLRLTSVSLKGRLVRMRVVCQVPGKLTMWTRPANAFLGAKSFGCRTANPTVRIKLTRRGLRKLRRSGWKARFILTGGGERHSYTASFTTATARGSLANGFWAEARAHCGTFAPTGFKYRLDPPPIFVGVRGGGPDVGWVRYYWYRYGVGWVGDSGWGQPFNIPDEYPGAVFLGTGEAYTILPGTGAWYAGAIAIYSRNAARGDWNWVYTYPVNTFNQVLHTSWCGSG
jgi:hypothetical protein